MANSVNNFNNARRRKNERRKAERQRAEWQSTQRQRAERPIVQNQRVERPQRETAQTNSFGGSFVQRAAQNPLTPTQKIEQERSQRMRQGISIASRVVRSQVGRRFASNTRINKGLYQNLRNSLAPVKSTADYTRSQQSKYLNTDLQRKGFNNPSAQLMSRYTGIGVNQGKTLRAGVPTNSNFIESWRQTATDKEKDARSRYGYDKDFTQKQIDERLDNSGRREVFDPSNGEITTPLPAKFNNAMPNEVTYKAGDALRGMRWDDIRSGFADSWARKNVEDTAKRQFNVDVDEETQAKLDAQRSTVGYGTGMAAGQMSQYALTRGLLSGAGLVGNGTRAAKGVKGALKAMGVEAGIDQLASVPMNIIDALKADSTGDMVDRFVRNQKYDLVFSGVMEFIPFFKNKSVREDIKRAFNLHTAAKKETNEATKEILEKKVGDILDATKEDIQKEVDAITNANNVSDNVTNNAVEPKIYSNNDAYHFAEKSAAENNLEDFRNQLFKDKQQIAAFKERGITKPEQIREFWRTQKMNGFTADDIVELPDETAISILRERFPQDYHQQWFQNENKGVKPHVEEIILSDKELRNAGLNIAYINYKETYSTAGKMGFQEFLDTPVTLYRGWQNGSKLTGDDVFISFTADRSVAEKMAKKNGSIEEITLRPRDTLGSYQTNGEYEFLVPRDTYESVSKAYKTANEVAEEPKQLYNTQRGIDNGTEKHQGTAERAGSGESDIRANVGETSEQSRPKENPTGVGRESNIGEHERTTGNGNHVVLNETQRKTLDAAGVTNAHMGGADRATFSNALSEGRAANKYGGYVDPQSVENLEKNGAKSFLSDDGMAGIAVEKDGNIVGAFKHPNSKYGNSVKDMLLTARANGGTKMDCYGEKLVRLYEDVGYVPVARVDFNASFVDDPLLLKNEPSIYVMMRNADDIDTAVRKTANGEYNHLSKEELDALPTMEYGDALAYRDDLLKNGGTPKSEEPKAKAKVESEEPKAEPKEEPKTEAKAEKEDTRTWQEKAREDYKTGKQRANGVEDGKIPSRENGEVENAIKRLKETKEFADIKDALDRGVKDGLYNRKYRHLDEEIDKAIKEIEEDPEKVINEILEYHPNGAKANDVPADAIPWVMKGYALCKWAEQNGMVALKEDIAATMAKAQSAGGSILRAGQVFTVMADPKTQRDIVAEFVEKMQEKYAKRLGDHKLTVSEDLLNKLDKATTDAEKSKILDDITVYVWNQVPQNFIDAMGSLRIVSMLANTTTMIRNIASNVAFAGVREVDKGLNTAMEAAAEKLGKIDKEHRTHSIYNHFSKENRKIQAFWYNDYGKNRNIIKGQSRWDEGGGALNVDLRPQDARHFGVKAGGGRKGGLVGVASAGLEGTRKATSWIMDTGDEMFLAPAYADAATQLMHVRGWGIDDLTPARMQEIRDYATEVAQKATYRDPSDMAMALAKWGHWQKGDGALRAARAVIVSGLQPFKKTPINIGKRSIEYSPVGFVKGVYDIRKAVQAGDSAAANKAITELSKGTTGTGLVVAGYLLSEQGIINAQLPTDDEGYLRRDLGEQDYALNLGGKSRSLQWAAPGAIPILAGATLHDQVRQRGWNSLKNPAILVSVLAKSTNPILEMSFMQSYMDLIEATDDVKKGDKFWVGLEQIALSYASQFVPTILGKFANTIDPVRRDTSSQAENPYEKALQKAINKNLINKIPKWSESLPAYEDAFGNIQTTENMKDRIIQNFVSPWYTKEIKSDDPAYKELFRINDAIPDTNLIPTNAIGKGKHELSLNGEKINLDPHDMEEYKRIRGEGNQKALEFIDSDKYKSMSDTERSKALEDIYNNAKTEAKQQMLLKKGKSEWDVYTEGFSGGKAEQIDAAKNAGINAKDYAFTLTDKTADADGNGTYSKAEYYDYLLKQSKYNDKQKAVLMAAKNKSWEGKYNPFITGEPPEGSKEAAASNANYTDAIKSTGLSEEQFNQVFAADKSKIDANGSGRVSQAEYQAYLDSFDFLTNEQKSAIWKQYNSHWKKNPYDGSSTASSGSRRRSRSGRRYSSGGGSSKVKARAKTESEKRFSNLQKMQAPTTGKGIETLSGSAKGLTKAQKKAMLKLMQKKLEV